MIKFETLTGERLIELKSYFSLRPTGCAESHLAYHLLWRPYYGTKYFADERGILWLQKIDYDDQATMDDAVKEAADAVCEIVNVGIAQAMNDHNRKKEEK